MKQNATLRWVVSVWWLTLRELFQTGVHVIWTTFIRNIEERRRSYIRKRRQFVQPSNFNYVETKRDVAFS